MDVTPAPVFKDALESLMDLMKDKFGGTFKAYYEGDPQRIPKDAFPVMIIELVDTTVTVDATQTDKITSLINIRVVMDKQNDYGQTSDVDLTERKLRRIVEARNESTGYYSDSSILGVIRANLSMNGTALNSEVNVSYDIQPRDGGVYTSEATVAVITQQRVIVPNRR